MSFQHSMAWIPRSVLVIACLGLALCTRAAEDGCVLHFDFDRVEGDTVTDLSGCGNHGKLGATEIGVGVDGHGAWFDGKGTNITVPLSDTLRQFAALTVEVWASPEAIRHAGLIWGAEHTDPSKQNATPIRFDWRGPSWKFWLYTTAEDGEVRLVQPPENVVAELTFPTPTWYHVVGTYSGSDMALYINGKRLAQRTFTATKALAPLKEPLRIGHGYQQPWNSYKGKIDDVRIYTRALTEAEVTAHYEARSSFRPATAAKEFTGTIDGKPYSPIGFREKWLQFPLTPASLGSVAFSNTGEVQVTSGQGWAGQYNLGILALWGQTGRKHRFYNSIDGRIRLTPPGQPNSLELSGVTHDGTRVAQNVQITAENEVKLHYELGRNDASHAQPTVAWPIHLWESALRFVGTEKGQPVKGRIMDLDRPVTLEDAVEIALSRGGCRLLVRLGKGATWRLDATRSPVRWINGWTTLSGMIAPASPDTRAPGLGSGELEFSLQVTDDATAPVLVAEGAAEICAERPFDFSELNEGTPQRAVILLPDRDVPIYGIEEEVKLEFRLPDPGQLKVYPDYAVTVTDAVSGSAVHESQGTVTDPWWDWLGRIAFRVPAPGVYHAAVVFRGKDGKELDSVRQELAVAGPIPQPVWQPGAALKLILVDSVDATASDPGHDIYTGSGKARVVTQDDATYLQLLSMSEMRRLGADRRDFLGCTLRLQKPRQDHIVEIIYADLDDCIIGVNVLEPVFKEGQNTGACLTRVGAGVITGGVFSHDGKLKSMRTTYVPTGDAPWCAVTCSNLYITPVGVARINLYEVDGGLPRLPELSHDRLIGVHTESGDVGLGTFAYGALAGEFSWSVPPDRFYFEFYRAIANMIRFLRFRGENAYNFGVYRYRQAKFPSKHIGSGLTSRRLDLPGLMAKMFEYNDLKIIMNVAPTQPLNIARHYRYTTHDLVNGADVPRQVSFDGKLDAGHFGYQPANPFHPVIQREYRKYAEELGERYGHYRSLAGISWLQGGMGLGEPCVFQWGYRIKKDDEKGMDALFFKYTYDDLTMAQFAQFAGVELPGQVGDPNRFHQRYEWIMANAREQWIEFRCQAMGRLHRSFKDAFHERAPDAKYYVFDYYGAAFYNDIMHMDGLDLVRRMCSDPKYYRDIPGFVYCPYVPTLDGSQYKEHAHGLAPREQAMACAQFARKEAFFTACDTGVECGRYLHRQFFETHTRADPARPWVLDHGRHMPGKSGWLCHCNYPQPNAENWFADFALMLAYATPNFISWMWCDGSYPSGHFDEMQQFTLAYRQLPLGIYKTVRQQNGVFTRASDAAFYVVDTLGKAQSVTVPAQLAKASWRDVVTGETVSDGTTALELRPYGFRVFVRN